MGPAITANDAELIALLRKGSVDENTALKAIYNAHYATVANFVVRNHGDRESARDVFQDGMLVLYRNIKQEKFNGESTIGTYLFSICRFLWLKTLRKQARTPIQDAGPEVVHDEPLSGMFDAERRRVLLALFDRLGDLCRKVLLLSFYENLDMREIALRTGFKDEQNARNKKFKCLNALKTLMQESTEVGQTLREIR